jgi:pyridoxal phosphate enzyme (YggS family)
MQEALSKVALLRDLSPRWHFIGHLQRRKVRDAIGTFELIHSVDSVELAQEINRRAGDAGVKQAVLLEVNIAGEASKAGFSSQVLMQELGLLGDLPHLRIQGLMTIPPPTERPEDARPFFRDLRELGARIAAQRISSLVVEYSMGMSHDFKLRSRGHACAWHVYFGAMAKSHYIEKIALSAAARWPALIAGLSRRTVASLTNLGLRSASACEIRSACMAFGGQFES